MLIGVDVSHHNYPFQAPFGEFMMIKATEGKTYVDPRLDEYINSINSSTAEPLVGFYHYARPENNKAVDEAKHFVDTLRTHWNKPCVVALDWEGMALNFSMSWAVQFLSYVEKATGAKPMFYTSSSITKKAGAVALADYPLWVAHYNKDLPGVYNWNNWTMWQFTSTPFDVDLFNGTADVWHEMEIKKYV